MRPKDLEALALVPGDREYEDLESVEYVEPDEDDDLDEDMSMASSPGVNPVPDPTHSGFLQRLRHYVHQVVDTIFHCLGRFQRKKPHALLWRT